VCPRIAGWLGFTLTTPQRLALDVVHSRQHYSKTMDPSQLSKYDLHFPGHWIAGTDRDRAFELHHLLHLVETEFSCAVACYSLFKPITLDSTELWMEQSKHAKSLNYIYARQFVFSLDSVSKLLKAFGDIALLPESTRKFISEFDSFFGTLKYIRDSALHIEDRGRGLRKRGKKIPTTFIVLGGFSGSRFDFTGEDGKCYAVDISEATLSSAHRILQSIIDSFQWE
jgi:hypothetical protein